MNIVEIKDLVKYYGDFKALDHLSLTLKENEVLGLLGPNGSGKTTTINCLLSLLNYDEGTITVFNKQMSPSSYDIKKDIGLVMQNVAVFDELTVYQNIDYFCGLYIRDKKRRKMLVEEALDFVGLKEFMKKKPKQLSGGLLRRLNIACGIAHKPKLIILDEPTVAVDPQSRNHILENIIKLNEQGATIIYTTHYMEEAEQICSRIVIMDSGKVIASGSKDELIDLIDIQEIITFKIKEINNELLSKLNDDKRIIDVKYKDHILTLNCGKSENMLFNMISLMKDYNVIIDEVYTEKPTLNDVFLKITGKELRD